MVYAERRTDLHNTAGVNGPLECHPKPFSPKLLTACTHEDPMFQCLLGKEVLGEVLTRLHLHGSTRAATGNDKLLRSEYPPHEKCGQTASRTGSVRGYQHSGVFVSRAIIHIDQQYGV